MTMPAMLQVPATCSFYILAGSQWEWWTSLKQNSFTTPAILLRLGWGTENNGPDCSDFLSFSLLSHGSGRHWLGWWQFGGQGSKWVKELLRAQLADNGEVHTLRPSRPMQENLVLAAEFWIYTQHKILYISRGNLSWESESVQDGWAFAYLIHVESLW